MVFFSFFLVLQYIHNQGKKSKIKKNWNYVKKHGILKCVDFNASAAGALWQVIKTKYAGRCNKNDLSG